DKRQELPEYREIAATLSADDRAELLALLSSCDPREFASLSDRTTNSRVRSVLPFYVPKPKSELFDIWARQKALAKCSDSDDSPMPEDERVEDAGLDQDDDGRAVISGRGSADRKRAVARVS